MTERTAGTTEGSSRIDFAGFVMTAEGQSRSILLLKPETPSAELGPSVAEHASPSGDPVGHEGDMPSLRDLLRRNQVAYAVLEDRTPGSVSRRLLFAWLCLVVVGVTWGVLTGLAFALDEFWLRPATTAFGCLAMLVLALTLLVSSMSEQSKA